MALKAIKVATQPFEGQKPGTSGLRKGTPVFLKDHYTENFVQCTLSAMGEKLKGCTLALGGDGRYFGKEAAERIVRMCAANRVTFHHLTLCSEWIEHLFYHYLPEIQKHCSQCHKLVYCILV